MELFRVSAPDPVWCNRSAAVAFSTRTMLGRLWRKSHTSLSYSVVKHRHIAPVTGEI
jgi:hypothetical protein